MKKVLRLSLQIIDWVQAKEQCLILPIVMQRFLKDTDISFLYKTVAMQ
jgi:hypothetical protein